MSTAQAAASTSGNSTRTRLAAGYLFALAAGCIWGTTGPLSTALYAEGAQLTDVGFWRVLLAVLGFALFALLFKREIFTIDRRGLFWIAAVGGLFVALFEVSFQFAIAGVGIAGAVALLYTAPVIVAVLANRLLAEKLTPTRIALAIVVMIGVFLTVNGHTSTSETPTGASRLAGIVGGLLAACSFAGQTLVARYAVPRYGSARMLFFMLVGGTFLLAAFLPLSGDVPQPPPGTAGWVYIAALGVGAVLAANFFYFAAVKRIDAAPTAVAASIEPFVGATLGLMLFNQQLSMVGWLGLVLVVIGVAGGYKAEATG